MKLNIFSTQHTIILVIVWFAFSNYNKLQAQTTNKLDNQQIWTYFYPHIVLNDKLDFTGDIRYRTFASRQDIFSMYIRPSWSYHTNKRWTFHGGIGFFYTESKEAILNKFEIRPWQGVQYNGPKLGILTLKHLIRAEERFSNFPQVNEAYYFEKFDVGSEIVSAGPKL